MALFVRRRWPTWVAAAAAVALLAGGTYWLVEGRGDGKHPVADPTDVGAYETILTPAADPPESAEPPPVVAVEAVLTASDAEVKTYADQTVTATSVPVLRRVNPSAAWIGDSPANRVLILLVATEHPFTFGQGARVTFTGSARRAGPGFGKDLGLAGEELADFERQGTYVEVTEYVEG